MPKTQAMNATNEANGNYAATPQSNEIHSGVGVLDKTVKILDALESGPATLGQLVSATGLARPTAHRLAIALERHRFVLRDQHGRFVLGSRFAELAAAAGEDRLLTAAAPILQTLLDRTGESAQIYRRQGDQRVCIAAVERASGLRDSIPVGAMLSMEAGSAAQILLAWEDSERLRAGHFVHEHQVDVQQVGSPIATLAYQMIGPDLLGQCRSHCGTSSDFFLTNFLAAIALPHSSCYKPMGLKRARGPSCRYMRYE